ncbi:hypothetical protein MAR_006014 [Mya arenaria]|uniref:PHD-type domain-containing protein n=1 Tax=Mya arenaria TaxID=6604 RepID=A0ABY7D8D5_MYAAR|nr:hypothetical protein MAR_006014 [Mya arenaria]
MSVSLRTSKTNLVTKVATQKNKLVNGSLIFLVKLQIVNKKVLLLLLLVIAGDIEANPGPRNASIFPCGHCELSVTWTQIGVCCDGCGVWHHKSCEAIDTKEMEHLEGSSVVLFCCICESMNIDSFTFNSYELHTSNMFYPLSDLTIDYLNYTNPFSPVHTSSPINKNNPRALSSRTSQVSSSITTSDTRTSITIPRKSNLRLLTVNCCTALDYVKPDIICVTESWLKGIKPGKEPSKGAIKSSEISPDNFTFHRNDRLTRGGGVFTVVRKDLIAVE